MPPRDETNDETSVSTSVSLWTDNNNVSVGRLVMFGPGEFDFTDRPLNFRLRGRETELKRGKLSVFNL